MLTSLAFGICVMNSIINDAGKYVVGIIAGAAALIVVSWFNSPTMEEFESLMEKRTPTMDQIRSVVDKESPWIREKQIILNRLDAMEKTDALLSVRSDSILSKLDNMQSKHESEIRNLKVSMEQDSREIHSSLIRIMAKLELMEETKKKDGYYPAH